MSEAYVLGKFVSTQSSDGETDYVREQMVEQFVKISRDPCSNLYLVKKVFCNPDDYEAMAESVSKEHTDKFQVLRLIGSDPDFMGFKQKDPGLEAYLVFGKAPIEAMRRTTADDPLFFTYATNFDADSAREFDGFVTNAVYKHTPEIFE